MEKKELLCTVGGNIKLEQPIWKAVWRSLKKLKMELPRDLAILLLCLSEENENTNSKRDVAAMAMENVGCLEPRVGRLGEGTPEYEAAPQVLPAEQDQG